jgi:hypothetical protein
MLDDFKTELQRLGGTNLERDNMGQRDVGRPPSPRPLPRIVEKSQDDHIEEADALDPDDEREWQSSQTDSSTFLRFPITSIAA